MSGTPSGCADADGVEMGKMEDSFFFFGGGLGWWGKSEDVTVSWFGSSSEVPFMRHPEDAPDLPPASSGESGEEDEKKEKKAAKEAKEAKKSKKKSSKAGNYFTF